MLSAIRRNRSFFDAMLLACLVFAGLLLSHFSCDGAHTRALFIGNSILTGNNGSGMCASSPDHDYYALVNAGMSHAYPGYVAKRIRGNSWEHATSTAEQNEYLESIATELEYDLDFVVIQLGDNVKSEASLAVFESGMSAFIEFVRSSCPKAKIVWVANWIASEEKQGICAQVCARNRIIWVDICPFNTVENQSHIGADVTYLDGRRSTVTDRAVAAHPGDRGMALIAQAILSALK